jgi:DNA-binding NarL/FixJ family response regulator
MKSKTAGLIRIVLADDNEIFREGFQIMLKKESSLSLIGQASDGNELIHLVTKLRPDVIITDIKMPVMDGIEATRRLKRLFPATGIIAFTMFDENSLIVDMLEAGARGYLLKNATKKEIIDAIRAVNEGEVYYCNSTNDRLAKMISESKFDPYKNIPKPDFSTRELEIMRLVCRQLSNKEIAETLYLSVRTVEHHRERVQEKVGARNIAGIVIYAIKTGIYQIPVELQ